jgi:hypothetical protein
MDTIMQHPFMIIGIYWFFSAIVGGMPTPTLSSSMAYVWLHNSLHILAGNLTAAVATKFPQGLPADTVAAQHTVTDTVVTK